MVMRFDRWRFLALILIEVVDAFTEQTVTVTVSDLLLSATDRPSTTSTPIDCSQKKSTSDEDEQRFNEIRIHSILIALGTVLVCSLLTIIFYWITVIRLARLYAPSQMPII